MEQKLVAKFFKQLYLIRRVEEEVARVYPTDKIKSPVHLSIGQEAVSVGVCEALKPEDIAFGTYRGHALYIAKGGDLNRMVAELYAKGTGIAKGKAGSMHLVDVNAGMMGASAVVGTTIPQAVGYALAVKMQNLKKVVVSFFGDGGAEEGVFHESMNFAALKKLPIIFVCENNGLAIHSHQRNRQSFKNIAALVKVYGISVMRILDGDIFKIYKEVKRAVDRVRASGKGPYFFECVTYRLKEHVGPNEDFDAGYRSLKEAQVWIKNDAVKKVGKLLPKKIRSDIELTVESMVKEAFEFAANSPVPDEKELYTDVYAERVAL